MATRGIGFGVSSLLQGSCRYCKVWNLFYAFVSFGDASLHSKLLWLDLTTFRIPSCEAARCYTRLLNLKLTWYSTLFNPTFRRISMLKIPFICFVINICKILNLILYGDSYISLVLIIMVINKFNDIDSTETFKFKFVFREPSQVAQQHVIVPFLEVNYVFIIKQCNLFH